MSFFATKLYTHIYVFIHTFTLSNRHTFICISVIRISGEVFLDWPFICLFALPASPSPEGQDSMRVLPCRPWQVTAFSSPQLSSQTFTSSNNHDHYLSLSNVSYQPYWSVLLPPPNTPPHPPLRDEENQPYFCSGDSSMSHEHNMHHHLTLHYPLYCTFSPIADKELSVNMS